ncbi:MAG: hypothetical protein QOE25_1027 [Actinomycetota bacterium]|nr:hypothetical protein [Actinomycetota bacterium]
MRDELRSLDLAEPPEQWTDIQRRVPRPSGPPPSSSARRILSGAVAFAVGIAGVALGIDALSSHPGRGTRNPSLTSTVPVGADGSVLWPARTADALNKLQADADTSSPRRQWTTYPSQVVDRFSSSVLGWPPLTPAVITYGPLVNGRPTATARLTERHPTCSSPPPSQSSSTACAGNAEIVHLSQPVRVGDGGIWAVTSVTSSVASIDATPGSIVANGTVIAAHLQPGGGRYADAGSVIGAYTWQRACASSERGSVRVPDATIHVHIAPDSIAGTDCGVSVPGYVWVATSANKLVDRNSFADPLNGDSSEYSSVVALPVVVKIPENGQPAGAKMYTDTSGWSANYPAGWSSALISRTPDGLGTGVSISAAGSTGAGRGPGDVVLTVTHALHPDDPVHPDDSTFPLSPSNFKPDPGPGGYAYLGFRGNGVAYSAQLYVGPDASAADVNAMNDVIASIRFPSLRQESVQSNGWVSLGPAMNYPVGMGTAGSVRSLHLIYVMRGPAGAYVLGDVPSCGEGESQTWDSTRLQVDIKCPNGPDIRYERDGTPVPGNPAAYMKRLLAYPVLKAWDGTLLVWPHAMTPFAARHAWSG